MPFIKNLELLAIKIYKFQNGCLYVFTLAIRWVI